MRIVLQRVKQAKVEVKGENIAEIGVGLLLLIGVEENDELSDIDWLCRKIINMRVFSDKNGQMNLSVKDIDGDILAVSQFTLHASTKKGNRPSFIKAAKPEKAEKLYEITKERLALELGKKIDSGRFGADMQVSLLNDGPVTIIIDSKNKE